MISGIASEALLYRPEMIDPSLPTGLWWCKDAEDTAAIGVNSVCKSILSPWSDLNGAEEWVSQFPYILVCVPPGAMQDEISGELAERFGVPVLVPKPTAFRGHGSMREFVAEEGVNALNNLLLGTEEIPVPGLVNLAEVSTESRKNAKRVVSGLPELDREIGGFVGGELSV